MVAVGKPIVIMLTIGDKDHRMDTRQFSVSCSSSRPLRTANECIDKCDSEAPRLHVAGSLRGRTIPTTCQNQSLGGGSQLPRRVGTSRSRAAWRVATDTDRCTLVTSQLQG